VDRLHKLLDMLVTWQGPISCALYISEESSEEQQRAQVDEFVRDNFEAVYFLDVHLLFHNRTRYPVGSQHACRKLGVFFTLACLNTSLELSLNSL
jgi:Glycosyl-transferase for dystroglycan